MTVVTEARCFAQYAGENHKQRAKLGVQRRLHALAVAMRLGEIEVPRVTA